jgi:hypothetical protein
VLAHRLILKPQARLAGRTATHVMESILAGTPVPKFSTPA